MTFDYLKKIFRIGYKPDGFPFSLIFPTTGQPGPPPGSKEIILEGAPVIFIIAEDGTRMITEN